MKPRNDHVKLSLGRRTLFGEREMLLALNSREWGSRRRVSKSGRADGDAILVVAEEGVLGTTLR